MKSQRDNVLSDIDEDNFDRAFKFLRPGETFCWCTMLRILTKPVNTVMQGGSDMGHRLSEDELQQALDFCGKTFNPTNPDDHCEVERLLTERFKGGVTDNDDPEITNPKSLDIRAPIIDPRTVETVVQEHLPSVQRPASDIGDATVDCQSNTRNSTDNAGCEELDMKAVLEKVNAKKAFHSEGVHNFEKEPLCRSGTSGGWVARLERGKLGLVMLED